MSPLITLLSYSFSADQDAGTAEGVRLAKVPPKERVSDTLTEEPAARTQSSTQEEQTPREQIAAIPKEQRAFKPYGSAEEAMYDKSPIVGMEGPAGTGKSRTYLEKIHLLMEMYPGARALIARKTRESISEAALYTFEEKVVPEGHPILTGPARSHRTTYSYPNGSMIVVCGLDKPKKIMSTEFDVAYVQEAVECDEEDFELISTRLRNGVIPYNQLIFDCNPDKPTHWLWQRAQAGALPMHKSHHEDNPTLWEEAPASVQQTGPDPRWPERSPDGRVGRWTPQGVQYLKKLDQLTGARFKRLRLGLWVSSEGGVYEDEWEADTSTLHPSLRSNLLPEDSTPPPRHWRRVWGVDFGFTAPAVVQKWAVDPDERLEMYRELYHTHMLIEDVAREVLADAGWSYNPGPDGPDVGVHVPTRNDPDPLPEAVVCDTDAEGSMTFEKHSGLRVTNAYKGISDGIDAVKTRMKPAGDGRPRLRIRRGAVIRRDTLLKEQSKPQCTAEEVDGYVWAPEATGLARTSRGRGERPVGKDDHGMDTMKYIVCYVDGVRGQLRASDVSEASGAMMSIAGAPGAQADGHAPKAVMGVAAVPMAGRTQQVRPFERAGAANLDQELAFKLGGTRQMQNGDGTRGGGGRRHGRRSQPASTGFMIGPNGTRKF